MTAARGSLFDEGPAACPFLALERDRERRADEPDARHRCYATPAPEPRAIAHQRAYCLTPNFGACPIFQDWAVRAAARPVPMRPVPSMPPPMTEDEMAASLERVADLAPASDAGDLAQAGLFDELGRREPPEETEIPQPQPRARQRGSSAAFVPTPSQPVIPPPSRPTPFKPAGAKPAAAPAPKPQASRAKPTLRKEDIVPAWERARYDLPGRDDGRSRTRDLFSILTLLFGGLAVVAVVAMVILLVPLLFGGRPAATTRPSQQAGGSPTVTLAPTPSPSPASTWLTYTIKLGDNLYRIATQFNITYDQLIAANPQITDPDYIVAGQLINIPPPDFAPPSPTGGVVATPSASSSP